MRPCGLARRLLPSFEFERLVEWSVVGVPTQCGPDWPETVIRRACEIGPHVSALTPENVALIWSEIEYQLAARFVRKVTEKELFSLIGIKPIKVSRLAVVPQTNRRGRLILNLSADVDMGRVKVKGKRRLRPWVHPSVNETTTPAEDQAAVQALGKARPALFRFMFDVPCTWEIKWQKVDLSDGFWRLIVEAGQEYNFVFQLPRRPGDTTTHYIVPSSSQMGWKNSPAFFSTGTAATRQLILRVMAATFQTGMLHPHRHENHCLGDSARERAERHPSPATNSPFMFLSQVFVDDFCHGLAGPPGRTSESAELLWAARCALHAIHSVFPPPEVLRHQGGKDSISEKKLAKNDALFALIKELLGTLFVGRPGKLRVILLPPDKAKRYLEKLDEALGKSRNYITFALFQSILGKLQYSTETNPVIRVIMTPLYAELAGRSHTEHARPVGVKQGSAPRESLVTAHGLIRLASIHPTHITEVVGPDLPHFYGYVDFAACGMGGVLLPCTRWVQPLVWRLPCPHDIKTACETQGGYINNNDGEAAAVCVQEMSLEHWTGLDMAGLSLHTGSDNSSTVSWNKRGASRASHPQPQLFIRAQGFRSRWLRRGPHDTDHIAGETNRLGDFPSRSFEEGFAPEDDNAFLTEFVSRHPLPPQLGSWRLVQPPPEVISLVFSILRNKYDSEIHPASVIGDTGVGLPRALANTLASPTYRDPTDTWNEATCSWPLLSPSGTVDFTKAASLQQRLSRRRFASAPSAWSNGDFATRAAALQINNALTPASDQSSNNGATKTHRSNANRRSRTLSGSG